MGPPKSLPPRSIRGGGGGSHYRGRGSLNGRGSRSSRGGGGGGSLLSRRADLRTLTKKRFIPLKTREHVRRLKIAKLRR